jgi:hypothetical protein
MWHLNFTDMNNLPMARVLRARTVGFFEHRLRVRRSRVPTDTTV